MRRALSVELRRGVGVWEALPLVVALVLFALAHPRDWAGDWYGWAYYLRTLLIVLGPLVVAAAAWQGGREHRRGLTELLRSASRPALHRAGASLASPAVWSLAALVAVALAMAAVTASHTSYGHPPLVVAFSAAAAVLMFAALGFVAGRLSPWRLTAPLLAVATYVALAVGSYSLSPAKYLSPGVELYSGTVAAPWWAPATGTVFLAVGAGALLLLTARRRWLAVPVLGLAVLAAVPVARAGQDAFPTDAAGERLVCVGGAPRVCLTRRHADQLPRVAATVQEVLTGLDTPGPVLEQRFGEGERDPHDVLNTLYLGADLFEGADLSVVRDDAARLALPWNCDGSPYPPDDDLASTTHELTEWVRDRPPPPYNGVLEGRTAAQALDLVRRLAPAAAACDLPAARGLLAADP